MNEMFDEMKVPFIFIILFMISVFFYMLDTDRRLNRLEKMISEQAVTMVQEREE